MTSTSFASELLSGEAEISALAESGEPVLQADEGRTPAHLHSVTGVAPAPVTRPKIIHFITGLQQDFGGKPFLLPHMLAILSAKLAYPDHQICVHYNYEPDTVYWKCIKNYVTSNVVVAPDKIYENNIVHFAHKADVLRLQILLEHGGIYFDTDSIVLAGIQGLPEDKVIMGIEHDGRGGYVGLCNAFIAAPREAPFLREWLDGYRAFNANQWNMHSVRLPAEMAKLLPDLIHVESANSFFKYSWDEDSIGHIFTIQADLTGVYSIHLWESKSWAHLERMNVASIVTENSTYNFIARHVLANFPDVTRQIAAHEAQEVRRCFGQIYDSNKWGNGSGNGSRHENNIEYISFVSRFMERNNIRTVVDLGCGDWQFSRFINWDGINYLGIDASESVVTRNSRAFGTNSIAFKGFSGFLDLPPADLLICKDVMQHWPNATVNAMLTAIKGKYKYCLITNDQEPTALQNKEIQLGDWRTIDLREPPFNRKIAIVHSWYVYDGSLVRKSTVLLLDN